MTRIVFQYYRSTQYNEKIKQSIIQTWTLQLAILTRMID